MATGNTTVIMYPVQWCSYSSLAWIVLWFTYGSVSTSALLQSMCIFEVISATTAERCSERYGKKHLSDLGWIAELAQFKAGRIT